MNIEKEKFIEALSKSILCPKDFGIDISREGKTCGYSVDCKKCWDEALDSISNFELTEGVGICQK